MFPANVQVADGNRRVAVNLVFDAQTSLEYERQYKAFIEKQDGRLGEYAAGRKRAKARGIRRNIRAGKAERERTDSILVVSGGHQDLRHPSKEEPISAAQNELV